MLCMWHAGQSPLNPTNIQIIEVLQLILFLYPAAPNGALQLLIGLSDGCVMQVVDILNPERKRSNKILNAYTGLTVIYTTPFCRSFTGKAPDVVHRLVETSPGLVWGHGALPSPQ